MVDESKMTEEELFEYGKKVALFVAGRLDELRQMGLIDNTAQKQIFVEGGKGPELYQALLDEGFNPSTKEVTLSLLAYTGNPDFSAKAAYMIENWDKTKKFVEETKRRDHQ